MKIDTRALYGALSPKEQGLSSNAVPLMKHLRPAILGSGCMILSLFALPLTASDDITATQEQASPASAAPREKINVMVTRPRGEVNQAQVRECVDRADAGTLSGEIVVCREVADDRSALLSDNRAEAQKRYAAETANKNAPPAPNTFGIGGGNFGIGFGGAPPPALMIDVGALPQAPAGSDADRIARGLPPLGQELELTEEQEKARREAMGIAPAPAMIRPPSSSKKKK